MTDSPHERIRRLFDEALQMPAAARPAFLAAACGNDRECQRRLEAMLAGAEDDHFLAAPTGEFPSANAKASAVAASGEGPGDRIGPYKLLQQIGEGGFGVVFLAEQSEPVQRRVALKVIKLGMDTRQVVARFEQERQALALMDHPHISRVLDAGATTTGRPFFVMDLVRGAPIVDYCDQNSLTIDDRLALFAQVCGALQHAHGKGVIHRDIKPSNILVGTQDGRPQAKVIDFGIAKATSQKLTDKTLFTEHQQVIGTLQYMSPEQAEGSLDIDTRTDVYSLGVLLYELLTGSTPFDKKTVGNAMLGELQRLIREVDPPRPSTRLSESRDTLASIAAHRRVEPKRLGLLLRGDLDWIVMKALEKDRTRRYETASDLAADIQRHRHGEAVTAAPPSASYLLRKFVRRNRGFVLASATTGAALLVGIVAFAWQANVAAGERDRAVALQESEAEQRTLAESHARAEATARKRAEAVTAFVTQALRAADPTHGGKQNIRIVDAMQNAVRMLEGNALRDQPEVAAELLDSIAEVLTDHGQAAQALPLAERALALTKDLHDGPHPDVANSLRTLGYVNSRLGRHETALGIDREALAMLRQLYAGAHTELATVAMNLASSLASLGRFAEAEPPMREALDITRRLSGPDDPSVIPILSGLGGILEDLQRTEEAEKVHREAREMGLRLLPDDHPHRVVAASNLGHLLWRSGRAAEAEALFAEGLACCRRMYEGAHPLTAACLNNLAEAQIDLGHPETAVPLFAECLGMLQTIYPDDHRETAGVLRAQAALLEKLGRGAEAVPSYEQAVAMYRALGLTDETTGSLYRLGALLLQLDRAKEAQPVLAECSERYRRKHGGDHVEVALTMVLLGRAWLELGQPLDAQPLFDEALAMYGRLKPSPSVALARMHWYAAATRLRNGEPARALPGLETAVAMAEPLLPAGSEALAEYRASLAECRAALAK